MISYYSEQFKDSDTQVFLSIHIIDLIHIWPATIYSYTPMVTFLRSLVSMKKMTLGGTICPNTREQFFWHHL